MYYTTLYGSKSTQDEDAKGYIKICNAMAKQIQRQEEAQKELEGDQLDTPPDFCEGLARVLSGIRAHINSYIISPNLGHHIVTMGSRFQFSHSFVPLPLTQLEDYVRGENISYKLRKSKTKEENPKEVLWMDAFVFNIIYRPNSLQNVST